MSNKQRPKIGSLPVVWCNELVNTSRGSNVETRSWIFKCRYCGVWHSHRGEERLVAHVCRSERGKIAYRYGYFIRLKNRKRRFGV